MTPNDEKPKREIHPNSLANLRPFLPGQSGNPSKGRGPSLTEAIKDILRDRKILDMLARSVIKHAMEKGDAKLINIILDRLDGPVEQRVEVIQRTSLSDAVFEVARYDPVLIAQLREKQAAYEAQQAADAAAVTIEPAGD